MHQSDEHGEHPPRPAAPSQGKPEPGGRPAGAHHEHCHQPLPDTGQAQHAGHEMAAPPGRGAHIDHTGHEQMFRRRFWVCLILTIPVLLYSPMLQMWLGFRMPQFPASRWIAPLFSVVIFFYGGLPFLRLAPAELANRAPGMMTLISLAISVAFVYSLATLFFDPEGGFFWELVTLIDVMLLGHWLEMRSVRVASGALNELARLMPDRAERLLPDGSSEIVPVSRLSTGDLVLVRPGASLPADGEVVEGESEVNEAMITGESRPVAKRPGSPVIGGTINGDGSLRLHVTATGEQTALAGVMRLVRQAQESKSRTQVLADRAAGWLFYAALAVAALTLVGWLIATGFDAAVVERVVTVLVIACPHALGLAIPLVVAISTSLAATNGILVRDRLALEAARNMDVVLFDKTGTLTRGEHGVVGLATAPGTDESEALALAAAVEGDSEHMIARGIRRAAEERGGHGDHEGGHEGHQRKESGARSQEPGDRRQGPALSPQEREGIAKGVRSEETSREAGADTQEGDLLAPGSWLPSPEVSGFEAIKGRGVRATVGGREVYVGGPRLLEMLALTPAPGIARFAERAGEQGQTVVYLVDEERVAAAFALADVIRPESQEAVRRLHDMGIEVAMLTGDSEDVARAVAAELGIGTYFAGVLPEHKSDKVAQLQALDKRVAMVGDGVNDAPALARADVGIAIGSGTNVAIESAGIILVKSNPLDVVKMIQLSQATYRKMVQNLFWATGYNVLALPLAAGVLAPWGILLSPAIGALFMSLSTVIVAVNAQLLRRTRL